MKKEDVDKMTVQEALDYAITQLVAQGRQSLCEKTGDCVYGEKFANGDKVHCAVGWLLDEDSSILMDWRGGIFSLNRSYPDLLPDLLKKNSHIFARFQDLHDYTLKIERECCLSQIASYCIDTTSNPAWSEWVNMGDK